MSSSRRRPGPSVVRTCGTGLAFSPGRRSRSHCTIGLATPIMSTLALPHAEPVTPARPPRKRLSNWQAWGIAMLAPYVVVFLVFVLYPVIYGLWLARHPQSY